MTQLMTQKQFADHRGVGKSAVSNWKRDKLLVLAEDPASGRIMVDVARSDAKLNAKLDPMRGRPPTGNAAQADELPIDLPPAPHSPAAPASDHSLADERQLHLREQRTGQALKNAQLARELVPLVEAERRVGEVGRAARERMQALMRSLAERFAAEKDVRTIMTLAEESIDRVFNELADAAERGEFAGDDDELTAEERAELDTLTAEEG